MLVLKTIAIGSDHAGFQLKERLKKFISDKFPNIAIVDFGTHSAESTDYPIFSRKVAEAVSNGNADIGIIMCGSGNGVNIVANRIKGIRSILAWNEEISRLGKSHNNANVLALPARFINAEDAEKIVQVFLESPFEGGRHEKRVFQIDNM